MGGVPDSHTDKSGERVGRGPAWRRKGWRGPHIQRALEFPASKAWTTLSWAVPRIRIAALCRRER